MVKHVSSETLVVTWVYDCSCFMVLVPCWMEAAVCVETVEFWQQ